MPHECTVYSGRVNTINRRINLLDGICPEVIALLQDQQFTPDVTRILRNMKAARQVEAVELMSHWLKPFEAGRQPSLALVDQDDTTTLSS